MLGMMQNKGGGQNVQSQGGNPGLAALFAGNAPAAPVGASGGVPMLPQIMAPQTPNFGMPPRLPMVQPQQKAAAIDPRRAFAMEEARRQMLQSSKAGQIKDINGMPRWFATGGRNA